MARKTRGLDTKKAIYVFWEGESEQKYIRFLNREFSGKTTIRAHREKGLFSTAQAFYRGNARFKSDVSELDEIWFFFDTEVEKGDQWEESTKSLRQIIESRPKRNPIRIRLLMTSGCVEYWFLLHYKKIRPPISTPADKEKILRELKKEISTYKKGDQSAIDEIAKKYPDAIENGRWCLSFLRGEGMPEETEKRDAWLFQGTHTFTTVHEALDMLVSLPEIL